jgi:hypothetical protein
VSTDSGSTTADACDGSEAVDEADEDEADEDESPSRGARRREPARAR